MSNAALLLCQIIIEYHWHCKILVSSENCVSKSRKGTLPDELNRGSGVTRSALTRQWKERTNEHCLKVTTELVQQHILENVCFLRRGFRSILFLNTGIAWMAGGGSDPAWIFFEGFVYMHWGSSKAIIYHQKVIFPHKSVPYSPEKIIQPHLFNIFTLKTWFTHFCRLIITTIITSSEQCDLQHFFDKSA